MLLLNFFLILGSIKSSYLGPIKKKPKKSKKMREKRRK